MFAKVPLVILKDKRLKPNDLKVLIALYGFANKDNKCWPKREQISRLTGIPVTRVSEVSSRLESLGYVSKQGKGGYSNSSKYFLNDPTTITESVTVDHPPLPSSDSFKTTVTEPVIVDPEKTFNNNTKHSEDNRPSPQNITESVTVTKPVITTVTESVTTTITEPVTRNKQTSEQTNEQTNSKSHSFPSKLEKDSVKKRSRTKKTINNFSPEAQSLLHHFGSSYQQELGAFELPEKQITQNQWLAHAERLLKIDPLEVIEKVISFAAVQLRSHREGIQYTFRVESMKSLYEKYERLKLAMNHQSNAISKAQSVKSLAAYKTVAERNRESLEKIKQGESEITPIGPGLFDDLEPHGNIKIIQEAR